MSPEQRAESPEPNPGSDEAIAQGCSCPVMDNGHGRGWQGGPGFVISTGCPLHGEVAQSFLDSIGDDE